MYLILVSNIYDIGDEKIIFEKPRRSEMVCIKVSRILACVLNSTDYVMHRPPGISINICHLFTINHLKILRGECKPSPPYKNVADPSAHRSSKRRAQGGS